MLNKMLMVFCVLFVLAGCAVDLGDQAGDTRAAITAAAASLQVRVRGGLVEGLLVGTTREFLAIPYAKPPLGQLRFAPAQPNEPWNGILAAKHPKVRCMQGPLGSKKELTPFPGLTHTPEDEDCLVLNVFTPEQPTSERLPVMVFIHGGGNMWGAGSDNDGRYLSEAAHAVVVTFNYRLAALGGVVLPELDRELGHASGNLTLRDQQLVLRWVQENIHAFAGDAGNLTIFGESGGSVDVCYHLFATGSEGLFQRAIMESGSCLTQGAPLFDRDLTKTLERSRELASALCPDAPDVLACLRAADAKQLARFSPETWRVADFTGTFGTYIDGELLKEPPATLLASGRVSKVPVILGTNAREGFFLSAEFFGAPWPLFEDPSILLTFELLAPGLLATYGVDPSAVLFFDVERTNDLGVKIVSDFAFRCPARAIARGLSRAGNDVYLYSFEVAPAVHGLELDYVFGWREGVFAKMYPDAEQPPSPAMIDIMQQYWTSFARTGTPAGPIAWPRYQQAADTHLVLDHQPEPATGLARAACDIIDNAPGFNLLAL